MRPYIARLVVIAQDAAARLSPRYFAVAVSANYVISRVRAFVAQQKVAHNCVARNPVARNELTMMTIHFLIHHHIFYLFSEFLVEKLLRFRKPPHKFTIKKHHRKCAMLNAAAHQVVDERQKTRLLCIPVLNVSVSLDPRHGIIGRIARQERGDLVTESAVFLRVHREPRRFESLKHCLLAHICHAPTFLFGKYISKTQKLSNNGALYPIHSFTDLRIHSFGRTFPVL
jgi:hypothetical protein